MTTTESMLARHLAKPQPVRQPRRKPQPRVMALPAPVSCGHPGGRRVIAFGPDGGRVDRCVDCVKVRDRVQKNGPFLADPEAEEMRKRMARGTHFLVAFQKRHTDPVQAAEDERGR